MSKENIVEIAGQVCGLLKPLESPDRHRVIQASLLLLGESATPTVPQVGGGVAPLSQSAGAMGKGLIQHGANPYDYFVQKDPHNKIEELAVAARFREQHLQIPTHTKDDLKLVISSKGARRNFDENNFNRDLNNARTKGLFNKGSDDGGGCTLSYYGQQYVDALPDRTKTKSLRKPKKTSRKSNAKAKDLKGKA